MATELAELSQTDDSAGVLPGISAATSGDMTTRFLDIDVLASVVGGQGKKKDPRCAALEKIPLGLSTRKDIAKMRAWNCAGGGPDKLFEIPTPREVHRFEKR